MLISPIITPNGNDMNGIFRYYLSEKNINPLDSFLEVSSSGNYLKTQCHTVIDWKDGVAWASNDIHNSWIQLTFKGSIAITHFSFLGAKGYCFATKFKLLGKTTSNHWKLIKKYESGDFCGLNKFDSEYYHCAESNYSTWKLPSINKFKALKWVEEESSCEGFNYISMTGIDVFGQLNPPFQCTAVIIKKTNSISLFIVLILFIS